MQTSAPVTLHEDTEKHQSLATSEQHCWEFKRHILPILSAINWDPEGWEMAEDFSRMILAADAFDDQA